YELEFLGQAAFGGANAAAPLALACFARVALLTDPFPLSPRPRRGRTTSGGIRQSDAIVFDERRPKYALRTVEEEASSDRPTLILCPSRLTEAERKALKGVDMPWWAMPDPATEIVAILVQSFGTGAGRLFESFCRAHGLRREDVTTDHVTALQDFLSRALSEL